MTELSLPQSRATLLNLVEAAVAAHANVIQVRLDGDTAVVETLATGSVVASDTWSVDRCQAVLSATFSLCDGPDDYAYGESRSGRMTGEKVTLPPGLTMVFVQFFPPRDGQRHMVARITYDADTCCGTCGG
ncbi:hypothetical protein A6A04_02395 [Paramagnetospirillum marisnigri]|uniref:Uncharacterized protein n=1 Tax=Paramagnetospirillum marisnigri TaxID=1285242 RepID=A0A178MNU8_9PROT|nr:hypothetical protein [Paramagnetospirillum marisnigri]OAN50271.1 hypothetical protein A6A04_02395 [Paramagnetospirillum marisnigri]